MKSRFALAAAVLAVPATALVASAFVEMEEQVAYARAARPAGGQAEVAAPDVRHRATGPSAASPAPAAMPAADLLWIEPPGARHRFAATSPATSRQAQLVFSGMPLVDAPPQAWTTHVAIGDLTGDRRNDVVVLFQPVANAPASTPTTLLVFPQDAHGTFQVPLEVANQTLSFDYRGMDLGDIDGDGRADIVLTSQAGLTAYRYQAGGTFVRSLSPGTSGPEAIQLVDVYGDGRLDAITRSASDGGHVFVGDGHGGFPEERPLSTLGPGHGFEVGNIDPSPDPDVVAPMPDGGWMDVLYDPIGTAWLVRYRQGASEQPPLVALGDFNHDGRGDVAVANFQGGSSSLDVLLQNSFYTLDDGQAPLPLPVQPQAMEAADLDGDGLRDLVMLHGEAPMQVGWLRQGHGGFEPLAPIGIGEAGAVGADAIAVGDVSSDRCPDVVALFGSRVVVFHGTGCRWPTVAICRTEQPVSGIAAASGDAFRDDDG